MKYFMIFLKTKILPNTFYSIDIIFIKTFPNFSLLALLSILQNVIIYATLSSFSLFEPLVIHKKSVSVIIMTLLVKCHCPNFLIFMK